MSVRSAAPVSAPITPASQPAHLQRPGSTTPPSLTVAATGNQSPLVVVSQWPPYAGYPLHLFPSPVQDEFRCIHCRQVLRAPLELLCEHLICRACYTEPTATSSSPSTTASFICPACHTNVTDKPHLNKPVQSLVHKLIIACPYKQYGCQHTSPIGKDESIIQQHVEQCSHAPTMCEGCGSDVLRGHRQHHEQHECNARKWQCEFCNEWVIKDEEESTRHRTNTFDRSLLCCHLRPCRSSCSPPTPSTSSASSTPSSARPHKRQREEEPSSESKETEPSPSPPSTAGLRTALPFWQMAAHLPVCPLGSVACAICSIELQRRDLIQHFASVHPLTALRIVVQERKAEGGKAANDESSRSEELSREQAEKAEKRIQEVSAQLERKQFEWEVERNAQRDSIQQLHAARQVDQRAIAALQAEVQTKKQELEQLRQRQQHQQQQEQQRFQQQANSPTRLSQASPSPHPAPQSQAHQHHMHMNVDLFGPQQPPSFFDPQTQARPSGAGLPPYTYPSSSSPSSLAIRLSTFQTTLNGLLCTHCLQPRFQLTQPGRTEPCGLHHPGGRMLTADDKYSCCGRVKGSVGCQPRAMHLFDFDALEREYPEFRDKCHYVRASTTGVSSGRAEANAMQL